jgi:hypothetical protein
MVLLAQTCTVSSPDCNEPAICDTELSREFIEMYSSLPEFWKIKSDLNNKRNFKSKSYDTLVAKLKEIEPTTDKDMVPKTEISFGRRI